MFPSVFRQTAWESARFALPADPDIHYFNPTLIEHDDALYLVTRRFHKPAPIGQNTITFWKLDSALTPFDEQPLKFSKRAATENWEDPRAFYSDGALHLSCATWRNAPAFFVRQALLRVALAPIPAATEITYPVHGNNGVTLSTTTGHEKNWVWFEHGARLHFIYHSDPHTVVRYDPRKPHAYRTDSLRWCYGTPRGGTPPVRVGDLYWSFFHSSIDISDTPPRRRYYMGAYAFHAVAPFAPAWITPEPLLAGSDEDPREPHAPLCVFPGGALLRGATWLVVFGVNDIACGWLRIPRADLEARCIPA